MSKQDLEERKIALSTRYDELAKTKAGIEEDMLRLQGAYDFLEGYLNATEGIEDPILDNVEQPKRLRKITEPEDAQD